MGFNQSISTCRWIAAVDEVAISKHQPHNPCDKGDADQAKPKKQPPYFIAFAGRGDKFFKCGSKFYSHARMGNVEQMKAQSLWPLVLAPLVAYSNRKTEIERQSHAERQIRQIKAAKPPRNRRPGKSPAPFLLLCDGDDRRRDPPAFGWCGNLLE